MSEKSVRGAGPGVDQAPDPAAPVVPGGGRPSDSGGAPVEPWGGERTERVPARDGSGPRVALVTAEGRAEGRIEGPSSAADTSRMSDSGRTTLMGVPSPIIPRGMTAQPEKPTTSPGHDIHLPSDKVRVPDNRPVAASGVIPAVELDPSSTRRIGKVDAPGKSARDAASERDPKSAPSMPNRNDGKGGKDESARHENEDAKDAKDTKTGGVAPSERTMAAAAETFRASGAGANPPTAQDRDQPERGWTADRTQEFHLDPPAPVQSVFVKTLAAGIAIAAGTGILVAGFIHSRLRGGAAVDQTEVAHAPSSLPVAPVPLPPLPPRENPVPPAAVEPPAPGPQPGGPAAEPAGPEAVAEPAPAPTTTTTTTTTDALPDNDEAGKADRRSAARLTKVPSPAGRAAAAPRLPHAPTVMPRSGTTVAPALTEPVPVAAPTVPPPLTAAPPPEKPARAEQPAARPDQPSKPEGTKPYDPDMPLPPSME